MKKILSNSINNTLNNIGDKTPLLLSDRPRSKSHFQHIFFGAIVVLIAALLIACPAASSGGSGGGNPMPITPATELAVSGTVAVGNQVGGANVTVACGSTTLSDVTKADGTYSITVGDQAAVTACSTSGVRVRATFTVDDMNYILLSGRLPAASATSTVVNVTRISDIAVRQSAGLADSGDGNWIDSAPGSIDWDQISTNAEAIATAVGLSMVNPIEDAFDVNIDNRIAVYTINPGSGGIEISIDGNDTVATLMVNSGAVVVPTADDQESKDLDALEMTASGMFAELGSLMDRRVANTSSAPTKVGSLSAVTVQVGNPAVVVDVSAAFSDPGDTLTYSALSADDNIASVTISAAIVTIRPVAAGGPIDITVTATDTASQTATQTIAVTVQTAGTPAVRISASNRGTAPLFSLNEANLDDATITLTLSGGVSYAATGNLATSQFTLNTTLTGLSVASFTRDSTTAVTLTLAYGGSDFDAPATLGVTVAAAAHDGSGALTTGTTVPISAVVEV